MYVICEAGKAVMGRNNGTLKQLSFLMILMVLISVLRTTKWKGCSFIILNSNRGSLYIHLRNLFSLFTLVFVSVGMFVMWHR